MSDFRILFVINYQGLYFRLVWTGYRRPLVPKDLWSLEASVSSKTIISKFDKAWKHEKEQVARYVC